MSYPIITGARRRWPKAPGVVALHAQPGRRNENTRQRRQPAYPGDALAWYANEFAALGMSNAMGGTDTLRQLFVLLIGLGMRESSGQYCEGRDRSASNVTAEAGLFRSSWNIKTASKNLPALLEEYWGEPNGFVGIFSEGLTPSAADLENYGSGQGAAYQFLAKYSQRSR